MTYLSCLFVLALNDRNIERKEKQAVLSKWIRCFSMWQSSLVNEIKLSKKWKGRKKSRKKKSFFYFFFFSFCYSRRVDSSLPDDDSSQTNYTSFGEREKVFSWKQSNRRGTVNTHYHAQTFWTLWMFIKKNVALDFEGWHLQDSILYHNFVLKRRYSV